MYLVHLGHRLIPFEVVKFEDAVQNHHDDIIWLKLLGIRDIT